MLGILIAIHPYQTIIRIIHIVKKINLDIYNKYPNFSNPVVTPESSYPQMYS
jgi:hypothetical protein